MTAMQTNHAPGGGVRRTVRQIHDDIEQTLRSRSAPRGGLPEAIEGFTKRSGEAAWRVAKRHPFFAVAALAAGGAVAAAAIGAAELTFGAVLALAAYKVLREGEPPIEALQDAEHAFEA